MQLRDFTVLTQKNYFQNNTTQPSKVIKYLHQLETVIVLNFPILFVFSRTKVNYSVYYCILFFLLWFTEGHHRKLKTTKKGYFIARENVNYCLKFWKDAIFVGVGSFVFYSRSWDTFIVPNFLNNFCHELRNIKLLVQHWLYGLITSRINFTVDCLTKFP